MRVKRVAICVPLLLLGATDLRAEYVVLRSGQRLVVTGYQLVGDKYHVQIAGGSVEIPAEQVVTIEPEEVFVPVPATPIVKGPFRELIDAAAARYHMDADLISSVIAAESNFDPKAVSRKNACGLMQLLPETAAKLGVQNIFDPRENIEGGTRFLRDLLQRYNGDLALALAAYNAGPERVQPYGRVPPIAETISYVRRVKQNYEKSKTSTPALASTKPEATAPPTSSSLSNKANTP